MYKVGRIHSTYLLEGYLIQISFTSSYCYHIVVCTSHIAFVYVKSLLQLLSQKFTHREEVHLQFRHMKDIRDSNYSCFSLISTSTTMNPIPMASATLPSPNAHCVKKLPRRCRMPSYAKSCALWLPNYTKSGVLCIEQTPCYIERTSHSFKIPR